MKIKLQNIAFVTGMVAISLGNNIGIGVANPILKKPQINPDRINSVQINPDKLKLIPTTISGEVVVKFGHYASQGSLQCKDLSVALYSDETLPAPPPSGGFQTSGAPIFSYSRKLTGNLNTGKCNYSISADVKYIGKKAQLNFVGGGDYNGGTTPVTIPSQPMQMNTQVGFGKIG
jgi:hypothetical protein